MTEMSGGNIQWLIDKITKLEREVAELKTHEQYAGDHFITSLSGYVYVPLTTAETLLDDSFDDVSSRTQIDVSGINADLANALALNLEIQIYINSTDGTYYIQLHTASSGGLTYQFQNENNDSNEISTHHVVMNCGTDGDIWYTINAISAANPLDVLITCFGYWV